MRNYKILEYNTLVLFGLVNNYCKCHKWTIKDNALYKFTVDERILAFDIVYKLNNAIVNYEVRNRYKKFI